MIVLGVDSSASCASCALTVDKKTVASFTLDAGNTHSTTLLPMIKACCDRRGNHPAQIDLFACARGSRLVYRSAYRRFDGQGAVRAALDAVRRRFHRGGNGIPAFGLSGNGRSGRGRAARERLHGAVQRVRRRDNKAERGYDNLCR